MNALETTQARAAGYALLAKLYHAPITAADPHVAAIDAPLPADSAVVYQQLFGFDIYPHESIFRGDDHLIGGDVADAVIQAYQQHGFQWRGDADHIHNQLALLGWLCAAEHDALEDEQLKIAADMRQRQAAFLQAHLLQWLPPFIVAVRRHGDPFYQEVAALTWQLILEHGQGIDNNIATTLIQPPVLDDNDTSLKAIVQYLTLPSASGWWLSARDMGEIGRALDLPRGFGGRIQTMMNLFRSATQYDQVDALLLALHDLARVWQVAYENMPSGVVVPWQTRLAQTITVLQTMRQATG